MFFLRKVNDDSLAGVILPGDADTRKQLQQESVNFRQVSSTGTHLFLDTGPALCECISDCKCNLRHIRRVVLNPNRKIKPVFQKDLLPVI